MVVYCMIHISLLVPRPLQHSVGNNILYCESLDTYYPGYMLYLDLFVYMVSETRVGTGICTIGGRSTLVSQIR